MSFIATPTLLQAAAKGELATAPPFELGKAQRKSLTSIGHQVERFLNACDALCSGLYEKRLPELDPYLRGLDPASSPMLKGGGLFVCPLYLHENKFHLQPLILSEDQVSSVIEAWRRVQLETPKTLPVTLPIPQTATAPLWSALLHLQPLRIFWEQELRRSHVETLLDRLPHAWMLDPTPLPPGAVIPKLELASWQQFVVKGSYEISSLASGKNIALNDSLSAEEWTHALHQALEAFPNRPHVLSESPPPNNPRLFGIYHKQTDRVEMLGAMAVHQDENANWRLSCC